jgi:hypothetical protein
LKLAAKRIVWGKFVMRDRLALLQIISWFKRHEK